MGAAVLLSSAQVIGAGADDLREAQYKVDMAQCKMEVSARQDGCTTTADWARDYRTRAVFVIDRSVMTDSQGRLTRDRKHPDRLLNQVRDASSF
jgi:hypothetical protein